MLRSPATRGEVLALTAGLLSFNEELKRRGIVSASAFAPADDAEPGSAVVASGFRKTGLLARGVLHAGERPNAILWTRKLADPGGGNGQDDDLDE